MAGQSLKILSISSVFPNPARPGHGLFVRSRLLHMADQAGLRIIAPIALFDYRSRKFPLCASRRRFDGKVEVMHPRWAYPPWGGSLNAACLFARLLVPVVRMRKEFPFQLIDAHFGFPDGIAACLLAGVLRCPFTVTLRGSEVVHARRPLRRRCLLWALRHAARVIAVSDSLRSFAISLGVDPARVRTVANGVDAGVFFRRDRDACRQKHGIPSNECMILSAGRLVPEKGQDRVIRSLKALTEEGLDAGVWLAGSSDGSAGYERELRRQAQELRIQSRVRFLGQVSPESLAELLSAADVFCHASAREGWPNVVHEALSCGTPVVATNVGAAATLIPSPEYGLVVDPQDPQALLCALRQALRTRWNHPAIAAWGQSRSWEHVTREVLEQMEQVIEENAAS
jgi:teichuronic acid biosynthesis glycosyltransferase TuaC